MQDVFQNIPPEAVFRWIGREYELDLIDEWVTHSEEGQPVPKDREYLIDVVITAIAKARKRARLLRTSETHAQSVHAANCWIDQRRVQKQLAKIALELENAKEIRYALERRQQNFVMRLHRKRLDEDHRTKKILFKAFRKQAKTAATVVARWGRFVHDKLWDVRYSDKKDLAFVNQREDPDNAELCWPAWSRMTMDIYTEVYLQTDEHYDDPNGEKVVD